MKLKKLAIAIIALTSAALILTSCTPATQAPGADGFTLRPAVNGERRSLKVPGFGKVNYYASTAGTGRPLVLTHSINAAGSAYEMKPLWNTYAGTRPIYALEWPGFGSSDRPDTTYTPELMASALKAVLKRGPVQRITIISTAGSVPAFQR